MIVEHGALVDHQPAGGKQCAQMIRRKRLRKNLPVPARPRNQCDTLCIRVVALVGTDGKRGSKMPGIQADRLKTLFV